ncbi:MAG: Lrp/AsnC family transcriptional regulator [Pseudomonadota bacterium]
MNAKFENAGLSHQDRTILSLLEKEGRMAFADIAEQAGMSKTPCWNRVRAWERDGVITGYHASVDAERIGLGVRALVHVTVRFEQYEAFERAVIDHPAVYGCFATTGDSDYMLDVYATDIAALDTLLRANLSNLPGVERFSTSLATRVVKPRASVVAALG